MQNKLVLLIDGNWLLFRSYFSTLSWFNDKTKNGIWQFKKTLSLLSNNLKLTTDKFFIFFDSKGGSFRNKLTPDYKATRPKIDPNLLLQLIEMPKELEKMNIRTYKKEGLEADDLVGIAAEKLKSKVDLVLMVTVDKDYCQLIDDNVKLYTPTKKIWKTLGRKYVKERYGITPEQFADFLALVGDKADNIIKVIPKMGEKTAAKLLNQFGSLKNIVKQKQYEQYKEKLLFNLKLTTIKREL